MHTTHTLTQNENRTGPTGLMMPYRGRRSRGSRNSVLKCWGPLGPTLSLESETHLETWLRATLSVLSPLSEPLSSSWHLCTSLWDRAHPGGLPSTSASG